jgi:predicted GNAT family acetyltransferase
MVEVIRKYDSISTFLDDCGSVLMQKECENNVILGICNNFLNKSIDPEQFILIAAIEKSGIIISCAVTTPNKTVLATFTIQSDVAVKPLASYFNSNQINLKGLSGESAVVNSFMEVYQKPITESTSLLLYTLKTLQCIELVQNSELILATMQDLPVLTTWLKNFQIDAALLPLKPDEEIQAVMEDKIKKKVIYKLIVSGDQQPVSMLAVVRETKNFAIISWVYTPPYSRSKGFASTAVYKLTELLLNTHQKYCALFADKSNPVSNKIYQNIGYQPVAEYLDINF